MGLILTRKAPLILTQKKTIISPKPEKSVNNRLLSKKQRWAIREATKRSNVWVGAVRSGKTFSSILRWIIYIANAPTNGELVMMGKSQGALYRNVIRPMQELVGGKVCRYYPSKYVVKMWGREIFCFGAYDESSEQVIRGMTCAGAYGDELTLWPSSFYKMLLSRLSVNGSKFFGTTNPDSPYHWLKKDFIDRKGKIDIEVFNFELEDNPSLSKEYKDALRAEYVGLWYKRFILGMWCLAEGVIYDFFDDNEHIITRHPVADYYILGVDYGITNPTVFELLGVNKTTLPKVWAQAEYLYDCEAHNRKKTDGEFSRDLLEFCQKNIGPKWRTKLKSIYIDPSAASLKEQFINDGFFQVTDAKNAVLAGIQQKSKMLKKGEYAIYKDCKNYIEEFYGYSWDERAQKKGEDKPIKDKDHCQDAGRYAVYSEFNDDKVDYSILTQM